MLSREHLLNVAKFYHESQEFALTKREKDFYKSQEQTFLLAVYGEPRKIDEQFPWEKKQEEQDMTRDWSGLE